MHPVSEKGLKKIDLLNDGCMLIRRSVFQRVFSESKTLAFWRGQVYKDDSGIERLATLDRGFRNLMKSHGFDFWCDFDLGSKVYHKFKTEKENKMNTQTDNQVPDNIDQVALEASEIWAAIAKNYRRLARTNKLLVENNQALTNKIVGLKNQIKALTEKLEASEKPKEEKDPPAPAK